MTESESPFWLKYAVDFVLLIAFLFILFFVKPNPQEQVPDEPEANPLEKMLVTEDDDFAENTEAENIEEQK